ncbi:hypothetical protein UFOVP1325_32 [uncultured Caudovirales phage]|uniref:Uncharacterized protein n=1 Tax=uncultured Caudovirales phage TaxID=2100421 RepID=A0A6J5RN45_9CAUD|nr:hypothetical protein UFOVP1325_32 [uncultured Caudovirales phage]
MSRVFIKALVAELSCRSVFLSSKTSPESVIKPTMAWLLWKASRVCWIRYAVTRAHAMEITDNTAIAMIRLSAPLGFAFGFIELGIQFGLNHGESPISYFRRCVRQRAHGCELQMDRLDVFSDHH